ncbi:flowering time control protein FPA-like [Aristolochia californica]|uniref:flowering time control protein FPA-like n=1 Tax=Aristolochia californica TaxID=171875 RepID=UPI0035DCD63A
MIGRRGNDRFRDVYTPRSEEKGSVSRRNAPPSRHLWVGNLSPHIAEAALRQQFLRFGDIESLAFLPGRSYAFINFMKDEDAIVAMKTLQGFVIGGLPMKIEFTKGERPLHSSQSEGNVHSRDKVHGSAEHAESFSQRDARTHYSSPEKYFDKSKGDKNVEPSEVLWIGFPSVLNVDEMTLRRAFSLYGEIEKITTFSGRSYAFVQFRSVVSACKAKDALQGKLFNNPRVNITFAKSELGPSEHVRDSITAFPFPQNIKSNASSMVEAASHLVSNFDKAHDSFATGFGQNRVSADGAFDPVMLPGMAPERGLSEDIYDHQRASPSIDKSGSRHDFPPNRPPRRPLLDEPWDVPDDSLSFQAAKRLKSGPFSDSELPEFPFSQHEKPHTGLSRLSSEGNMGPGPLEYGQSLDHSKKMTHPHTEIDDVWKSHDYFEQGSGSLPPKSLAGQRFTPEIRPSPPTEVWKWEGTIAKGGTPVCRARCFPVGKVLDFMLPEFLNCTARTDLDMLAKHFYQAANFWVVFFVAESDSDIVFYNEFMHYLEERQRAAVAKLSEKTTLFLVPPSDFSERVLKVPGKLSISGVILSFQHTNSNFGSLYHQVEAKGSKLPSLPDTSLRKSNSPEANSSLWSQNYPSSSLERLPLSSSSFPTLPRTASTNLHMERASDPQIENRYYQLQHQNLHAPSNWSPHQTPNSHSSIGNFSSQAPSSILHFSDESAEQNSPRQRTSSSQFSPGNSSAAIQRTKYSPRETKPQVTSSVPLPPLQPEQLVQLASLLGHQHQQQDKMSNMASRGDNGQSSLPNQLEPGSSASKPPYFQNHASVSPSRATGSQVSRGQQFQPAVEFQSGGFDPRMNQQGQKNGREDTEGDPQKRLQATLQLAAALLQQIQQQAKTSD